MVKISLVKLLIIYFWLKTYVLKNNFLKFKMFFKVFYYQI